MCSLTVISSHGSITIDETGKVIDTDLDDTWDNPLPVRFNLNEWQRFWKETELPGGFDILDLEYEDAADTVPACHDFRINIQQE
jgi:hypothetical protein